MTDIAPGYILALIQIHCYPFEDQITMLNGSAAATSWVDHMVRNDLIEPDPPYRPLFAERPRSKWRTTERGMKHIENLCNLDLPRRVWV